MFICLIIFYQCCLYGLFQSSQSEQPKQNEPKDDIANESDIEFVETGPQVIEIPDANDSR